MNGVDLVNRALFEEFFKTARKPKDLVETEEKESSFTFLAKSIHPRSFQVIVAKNFRPCLRKRFCEKLLVEETQLLFANFLANKVLEISQALIKKREAKVLPGESNSLLSFFQKEPSLLSFELEETFQQGKAREKSSKNKKIAISTKELVRPLSVEEIAAEMTAYFTSIFCGIDLFSSLMPIYTWLDTPFGKKRTIELFRSRDDSTSQILELDMLEALPVCSVQAICLLHMLLGSQDVAREKTFVRIASKESIFLFHRIYDTQVHRVMSSSLRSRENPASMRIWWIGLSQAEQPLEDSMLESILSWNVEELKELHQRIGFYREEEVEAQSWRLEKMREKAEIALFERSDLSVRSLFLELIHNHESVKLLEQTEPSSLKVYDKVGQVTLQELSAKQLLLSRRNTYSDAGYNSEGSSEHGSSSATSFVSKKEGYGQREISPTHKRIAQLRRGSFRMKRASLSDITLLAPKSRDEQESFARAGEMKKSLSLEVSEDRGQGPLFFR